MLEESLEALDVPFANIRGLLHGLRGASGIRRHLKFLIKTETFRVYVPVVPDLAQTVRVTSDQSENLTNASVSA